MKKNNNSLEIYFDDLTEEAKKEIINNIGGNGNYDIFPIAEIPIGEGHDEL